MERQEIRLILIPAPHDPPSSSPEYEKELVGLVQSLQAQGAEVSSQIAWSEAAEGAALTVKLAAVAGPALGGILGAWLHAKYGRKVRLKIGDIEAEAQTEEQVQKLLKQAEEFQQRNQPKVIHEP
jgi:hypothetical protein